MRITQTTSFPKEHESRWTVHCARPTKATLQVRHPRWAGSGYVLRVNGKVYGESQPGSYRKVQRIWHEGDVVAASLPMQLSVEPMRDDPELKAFLYGPFVMAGLLGTEGMPQGAPYAAGDQLEFRNVPAPTVPNLALAGNDLGHAFLADGPLQFTAAAADNRQLTFKPLAFVTKERYSVYWRISAT